MLIVPKKKKITHVEIYLELVLEKCPTSKNKKKYANTLSYK